MDNNGIIDIEKGKDSSKGTSVEIEPKPDKDHSGADDHRSPQYGKLTTRALPDFEPGRSESGSLVAPLQTSTKTRKKLKNVLVKDKLIEQNTIPEEDEKRRKQKHQGYTINGSITYSLPKDIKPLRPDPNTDRELRVHLKQSGNLNRRPTEQGEGHFFLSGSEGETKKVFIEDMFHYRRIRWDDKFVWLFLILYTPFGLVILGLRILVFAMTWGFLLYAPKWLRPENTTYFHSRFMFPLLGCFSTVENRNLLDRVKPGAIIVANHNTNYDPVYMTSVVPNFRLVCAGSYQWFWEMLQTIGILMPHSKKGTIFTRPFGTPEEKRKVRDSLVEAANAKDYYTVIYPEGAVSNCHVSLMQFQKFSFGLGVPIIPVALHIENPWPVNHFIVGTNPAWNFIATMFIPYFRVRHEILPHTTIQENETSIQFAKRIQLQIAMNLKIGITNENWKAKDRFLQAIDKMEYNENYWNDKKDMEKMRQEILSRGTMKTTGAGRKIIPSKNIDKLYKRKRKDSYHNAFNKKS